MQLANNVRVSSACVDRRCSARHVVSVRNQPPAGAVVVRAGRTETAEETLARRQRESVRYEDRVRLINSLQEWEQQVKDAGSQLVVLEVQSETVCETGMEGDDEDQKEAKRDAWGKVVQAVHDESMEKCRNIKHTFQRIARDCDDAIFLEHQVEEEPSEESSALVSQLGIEVLPTLQFWKNGKKIYEHRGAQNMDSDMAEGVLYYEGSMAGGVKAGEFVGVVKSKKEIEEFAAMGDEKLLKVVVFAKTTSAPCMHMYPAVVALAKNFVGFASFARLMVDESAEARAATADLGLVECPSFVMFRKGVEVGRYIGQSRADLLGKILELQQAAGVAPPTRNTAGTKQVRVKQVRRV